MSKFLHIASLLLIITAIFGIQSCSDGNDVSDGNGNGNGDGDGNGNKDVTSYFKLETADGQEVSISFPVDKSAQTVPFVVKSNGSWKIAPKGASASWLALSVDQGEGDGSFSLTVDENKAASRSAQLSFTINDKEMLAIVVAQEGGLPPEELPVADILDIVFKADGTAEDVSPLHNLVTILPNPTMFTLYSDTYQRYIAKFNNNAPGESISSGYYRVDYANNTVVKDALADGHTLEAMFMLDVASPLPNKEIKVFCSQEAGGTGIMIGNSTQNNAIIFLPNVSANGSNNWVWTNSQITPVQGKYYHVVGVWNKSQNKAYIYVDGVLKATQTTTGNYNFPSSANYHWFGIGADAGSTAQCGWRGDVVVSRVYDQPLAAADVTKLWNSVKNLSLADDGIKITGVSFLSGVKVLRNAAYTIAGSGFQSGDRIKFVSLAGSSAEYLCDGTLKTNALEIAIPSTLPLGTARYRIYVLRGGKTLDLGFATLNVVDEFVATTHVIAHRGYWDTAGSAQNSLASLKKAQELGVYGSEFDIWITTDDSLMLCHDPKIDGVTIQTSTYNAVKDKTLSNGEKIPTLNDYLVQGKKYPNTKLVLEIKTHSDATKNNRVCAAVVNAVRNANLTGLVEYIAFSLDVCKELIRLQPNAVVSYLNGDKTPAELHALGIKGIDYELKVMRSHKNWIAEAHNLGMTVNVWTVNAEADILEVIGDGVDFITTDKPVDAKRLADSY